MDKKGFVVITGASQGIGKRVAEVFARKKFPLVLIGKSKQRLLDKIQSKCLYLGAPSVEALLMDVADVDSVMRFAHSLAGKGKVSVLVNNAGVLFWDPVTSEQQEQMIKTNIVGTINMTIALLPHITGAVINLGSDVSYEPHPNLVVYSYTKREVREYTQHIAENRPDLRIHCVHPDRTRTQMNPVQGRDARQVAGIVYYAAKGKYRDQVNVKVWDLLGPWHHPIAKRPS